MDRLYSPFSLIVTAADDASAIDDDDGEHWEELAVPVYPQGAVIAMPSFDASTPPATKPADQLRREQ